MLELIQPTTAQPPPHQIIHHFEVARMKFSLDPSLSDSDKDEYDIDDEDEDDEDDDDEDDEDEDEDDDDDDEDAHNAKHKRTAGHKEADLAVSVAGGWPVGWSRFGGCFRCPPHLSLYIYLIHTHSLNTRRIHARPPQPAATASSCAPAGPPSASARPTRST